MVKDCRREQINFKSQSIWYEQLKQLLPIIFMVYIPSLGVIFALAVIAWLTKVPVRYFTGDPAAISEQPVYIGFLSNVGILFWCSSATICIFSYLILKKHIQTKKLTTLFFLASGCITFILLLDDLFLFHEAVFPRILHIPEKLVYALYAAMLLTYLGSFRRIILKSEFIFLLLALGFFAISIVLDLKSNFLGYLVEDGFKFLGIISWSIYFTKECLNEIQNKLLYYQVDANE